ncbi:conserved hypothetical protein [Leishmania braziliensis MHOM/BR/75/M2904]|uniref:Uncharacterized protein n=2 Tax=Leishmania braziliensis TaxID=5660 RepID=A4H4B4_LEIBR|nr:conserved hypothetical protein [Leishmania braziliensis MHOM/BR/75/M2904]CAJ2466389.1 unnamed protein product [Leishmania braziliensis]CAM36903.1 conserved hypothetical protein [Leishmania braziliensis MHOM/BR/75/M2904]SYZ62769.1 hypothetical_protein [Leishmania braziliensis MHOM/BR/75/M2904]
MTSLSFSNATQAARGGNAAAMPPPGAHLMMAPPPSGGNPFAAAPPGFRGKVPPGQMPMMAGKPKIVMRPPSAAEDGQPLAANLPLNRPVSQGTTASHPGPPGRGLTGSPRPPPQFALVNGKKIMVPPGTKLPMGNPGLNLASSATAAVAPPQAMMHGKKILMMPPGQGLATSRRPSFTTSPPPGGMTGRGAAAAASGRGGPSPFHPNPGQSLVRPPMQVTASPSPRPQPTREAAAGATGHKPSLLQSLTSAFSFLKRGSDVDKEREVEARQHNPIALQQQQQQQQQQRQTPPGPAVRGKGAAVGPSRALMPNSHPSPSPARRPSPKQQPAHPPLLMSGMKKMMIGQPPTLLGGKSPPLMSPSKSGNVSGGGAAATRAPIRVPPAQMMAIKRPPGGGGHVVGTKKAIMDPPPPATVRSRANSLERPPLGASRSSSVAAVSLPGARSASSPQLPLQPRPSPMGLRPVKRILGSPLPHAQLIPAPSQQQPQRRPRSGSASPTPMSVPSSPFTVAPPEVAAAATVLRVPSSTVFKEEQLPSAGIRSPRRRHWRLGESSEDSDSDGAGAGGGDGGAHASAQVEAASHSHIASDLRSSSSIRNADGVVGSDRARENTVEEKEKALQEDDNALLPESSSSSLPRQVTERETEDHSLHHGDNGYNNDTHPSTDALTSKPEAAGAAAAVASPSSSMHHNGNKKSPASTTLVPVRKTATSEARIAAAAAKRRQEEERQRHEAARKDGLVSKRRQSAQPKSVPPATHASRTQSTAAARVARESPSPQEEEEEDNTQKPSNLEPSSHSITSTLSRRSPLSVSDDSDSVLGAVKSPRSPARGGVRTAGDGGPPASPGSVSTPSRKRIGKSAHFDPSGTPRNEQRQRKRQRQRQLRRPRSRLRTCSQNTRRSTSKRGNGNVNGDHSDAADEEDDESGLEELTSSDLYRLAKFLRDSSAGAMGAGIDDLQRRDRRRRSLLRGDNGSDRDADADSSDDTSWGLRHRGRQRRQQHSTGKRRSALPLSTVGIPWRYTGPRRSLGPFASPPPVRRPLGYINVGGGRYARVGGSPYTNSRGRPRATSVEVVPLDTTNTRALLSRAGAYGSRSPLVDQRNRRPSALVDAGHRAVASELKASALLDSKQASSSRGGGRALAPYYSREQRQLFRCHSSVHHPHTRSGCSHSGLGLDDTMSSAVESQHPYCVSTSALLPAMQSMVPLRGGVAATYEPHEPQRGRSSPLPDPLPRAADQPYNLPQHLPSSRSTVAATGPIGLLIPDMYKVDPALEPSAYTPVAARANDAAGPVRPASLGRSSSDQLYDLPPALSLHALPAEAAAAARSRSVTSSRKSNIGGDEAETRSAAAPAVPSLIPTDLSPALSTHSQGLGSHLRTSSPRTQQQWRQRQEQNDVQQTNSGTAASNLRRVGGVTAVAAHPEVHPTYADPNACWPPSRKKETVYLSKATIARLSTPQGCRGSLGRGSAAAIRPISRRSHGGGGGNSSVVAQTCTRWLDELLASTTVTTTGVRTGWGVGGGEDATGAANAIPVVDLRREFKPYIVDSGAGGRGSPSNVRAAFQSLRNIGATDYTNEFTGSRARPHVPVISFKHMIGTHSATGSPPRMGGAATVKTVSGVSDGLPFRAYSSIRVHDPTRKSPWALAPEREGLDVLPGRPALSRRRRIAVADNAAAENDTVVEEVHLDEHRRPYLVVRPVLSSEEKEAQRAAVERLSRPKPIYRRAGDPLTSPR